MNENKDSIKMIVELPMEWVLIKKQEAKDKGLIWSKYAKEQLKKVLMTKKFTR